MGRSVRWSKSLRAKASCAMQVFWLQFALNVGSSGAMSEPCPIQKLWISGRFFEDILQSCREIFAFLTWVKWYNLCWGVFFRFFRHSMYSWQLSYMTSRLWQAAWDLTPSSRNFHLEVDKSVSYRVPLSESTEPGATTYPTWIIQEFGWWSYQSTTFIYTFYCSKHMIFADRCTDHLMIYPCLEL